MGLRLARPLRGWVARILRVAGRPRQPVQKPGMGLASHGHDDYLPAAYRVLDPASPLLDTRPHPIPLPMPACGVREALGPSPNVEDGNPHHTPSREARGAGHPAEDGALTAIFQPPPSSTLYGPRTHTAASQARYTDRGTK